MAIKKSELYSSLWKSCDELRGGMDASQYKDYVLTLLFMKYVSDKYDQPDSLLEVPDGASFQDMVALKGKKDIGEEINKIVEKLADANDLRGVINVADFDNPEKLGSGKAKVDTLTKLVGIFQDLDFRGNRADGDDLLGDAYEYLMRHFATESGKSKGQFYTPAEVSRIMSQVIGVGSVNASSASIYDPTCGSGSLLIRAHDEAKARTGFDISIYGQEKDNSNRAMAKMNMILHNCPTADIRREDTLANPLFLQGGDLKRFDFAVANPPFSTKSWSNGIDPKNDLFHRFEYGIPPTKNGDYAFLLHLIASLKSTGKGAIILPHGVLFRGNVEADIRREIVRRGLVKGIIGLPPNLFYGTGIPACILVLDKEGASERRHIFMIDASKGFLKDGSKNRLREQDIHKVVDAFKRTWEIPKFSRLVSLEEIAANAYNLNIPRYIDNTEAEDIQDLDAHLNGGIPNRDIDDLSTYWSVFPKLREALFEPADRPNFCKLRISPSEVTQTIREHDDFVSFTESLDSVFAKWKLSKISQFYSLELGDHPKALIHQLSESLLESYREVKLISHYDVYQHLMNYWQETMQDDVYMIVTDGWAVASKPKAITEKKSKERIDFTIGKQKFKAELIPPSLIIERFFSKGRGEIEQLEATVASIAQELEELKEQHGGEEGLLSEVENEDGKITKGAVVQRRKEIHGDSEVLDERRVLDAYLEILEREAIEKKKLNDAQNAIERRIAEKYAELEEDDIKSLVIEDKWSTELEQAIQFELDRVCQTLAGRIKQLAERYETPLPDLTDEVETLAARVAEHLKKMGAVCK